MFDAFPIDLIEQNNGMRIDINFIAEARYGETLVAGYIAEGNVWQFEIKTDSDKVLCRSKIEFK